MRGYSLVDLLVTIAIAGAVAAVSLPRVDAALDEWRSRGAAIYLAQRVALARMQAVHRGANVGIRFEPEDGTYRLRAYADGNDNGVRAADITLGYDQPIATADRLDHLFSGVRLGFIPGARLTDGTVVGPSDDPVRFGSAHIIACAPAGTATSGTLYLRGRGLVQYAVIVLGATGRTRIMRFNVTSGEWGTP